MQIPGGYLADRLGPKPGVPADTSSVPPMVARYFQPRPLDAFAPEVEAALAALSQAIREAITKKNPEP